MQRLIERADQEKRQQAETRIAAAGRGTMNYESARSPFGPDAIACSLTENRRRSRLAIDEEVVPLSLPTGKTMFALSELARQAAHS